MVCKSWLLSALSVLIVLAVAVALYALGVTPGHVAVTAPFLLVVVLIAAVWGREAAVVASLASALVFNYLIIPPANAFSLPTADEGFLILSLLSVALIVGTWKDRTLRVERQVRELAASEKLQKILLDTISHDFKTPLTAIVGSLSSLAVEGQRLNDYDRKELIETAYQQATWLNKLISDVLEITRLEAGTARLRREPASILDLVRQAHSQVREMIGRLAPPAEQRSNGAAGGFAEHVPTGHVNGALRILVPAERRVHPVVDQRQVAGVRAHQRWRHLAQRGPRAAGMARQVRGAERADLAPSRQPVVGLKPDSGARERRHRAAAGHDVATVRVMEVVAKNVDASDLHFTQPPRPAGVEAAVHPNASIRGQEANFPGARSRLAPRRTREAP